MKFLTGYGQRPQHLLGTIGLSCFVRGAHLGVWLAIYWVISRLGIACRVNPSRHLSSAPLYAIALLLLVGAQFMSMGFLAELFIAYREPDQPPYSILETTGETGGREDPRRMAHPEHQPKNDDFGDFSSPFRSKLRTCRPNTMHRELTSMEIPGDATLRRSIYAHSDLHRRGGHDRPHPGRRFG